MRTRSWGEVSLQNLSHICQTDRDTFYTYMCLPISPSESSENNLTGSETFALCKRNKHIFTVTGLQPSSLTETKNSNSTQHC